MKRIIPLMIILLVVLVGCGKQESTSITGTFIGGTQGVQTSLQTGSPPTEVFDKGNTAFDIDLKIQNVGESEIKAQDMQVKLIGLYPQDFGKTEADFTLTTQESITPKIKTPEGSVIEGGITNLIFSNLNFKEELAGDQLFNPRLDICYKYNTRTVSKVCVLRDLLRESETSFCKVSEQKEIQNSGAPLQITKVVESRSGTDKVALTIDIANVGTGNVFRQNNKCAQDTKDKNRVYITVDTGVTPGAICSGLRDEAGNTVQSNQGYITLDETGKATVTCTQQVTTNTDFEKIVNLRLDYNYEQAQPFQLSVKHLS